MFFNEWGPPASEEAIDNAVGNLPELPDDLRLGASIASTIEAGWMRIFTIDGVDHVDHITTFLRGLTTDHYLGEPMPGPHLRPQGKLLQIGGDQHECVIELEGDHPGRLWNFWWGYERFWHPVAWSLADLVACTVDLIEIGWYQFRAEGPHGPEQVKTNEDALEFTADILERWACNPLILQLPGGEATFVDPPPRTT